MLYKGRKQAVGCLWVQVAAVGLMTLLAALHSSATSWAVFVGGLIACGANAFFVYRAFAYSGALAASRIVRAFYAGEFGKVVLAVVGLAFALGVLRLNAVPLLAGYMLAQGCYWVALCLVQLRHKKL